MKKRNYPIAEDGWKFFLIPFILGLLSLFFSKWLFMFFMIISFYCAYFFRNPIRIVPKDEKLIVAPADGKVLKITEEEHKEMGKVKRIIIFLSIFNVHITKAPIDGKITKIEYFPGKFFNALNDKSSEENEHNIITIEGKEITAKVKQIAGIIARRIVNFKKEGDMVQKGKEIGIIRFGSRVELFLPAEKVEVLTKAGDSIKGSETIVAKIR